MSPDWIAFGGGVVDVITALIERQQVKDDRLDACLQALTEAYYATLKYEQGADTSRENQLAVAQAWDLFAEKMRRYDKGLYHRLLLKGRFWREGATWSPEEIRQAKIGLEHIRLDARVRLLVRG